MIQKITDWLHAYLTGAKKRWIAIGAFLVVFAPEVPTMLERIQEVDFTGKSATAAITVVAAIVARSVAVKALAMFVTPSE